MSIVRINALEVPAEMGDELARRFATRAGEIDKMAGFEGFELLKPTDGGTRWLVYTRWRDEESFRAWVESDAFAKGHAHASEGSPAATGSELWSFDVVTESHPE